MQKGKDHMVVLTLKDLEKATFVERLNRFLGKVDLKGKPVEVHIHDPGRLKELLYKGNEVFIKRVEKALRKTRFDLIAARKGEEYVFVHSGYHNKIVRKLLDLRLLPLNMYGKVKTEVTYGKSRMDFTVEDEEGNKTWIEVKGCTLSKDGKALFPNAPTKRGRKHLEELMELKEKGDETLLLILVFARSTCFAPNFSVDPEFASIFWRAVRKGIKVLPLAFSFRNGDLVYKGRMPLCTER